MWRHELIIMLENYILHTWFSQPLSSENQEGLRHQARAFCMWPGLLLTLAHPLSEHPPPFYLWGN